MDGFATRTPVDCDFIFVSEEDTIETKRQALEHNLNEKARGCK